MREKDILKEENADTPCKRVYFLVQCMYLSRTPQDYHEAYFKLINEIQKASPHSSFYFMTINDKIMDGHYYKALKAAKEDSEEEELDEESDKEWVRIGSEVIEDDWNGDGVIDERYYDENPFESREMWWEVFGAYTVSNLKASGQGRINHTVGASVTSYPGYDLMPRAYYAVSADARRSLKLLFEVFYDPYWASILELGNNENITDIDFDFGFIYAYSEQFRVGIHFQRPFIAFYYKF